MDEKKIAVRLITSDWQTIVACLYAHIERKSSSDGVVWTVGRNRIKLITDEIVSRLPRDAGAVQS